MGFCTLSVGSSILIVMIEKDEVIRMALFEGLVSFHPRYEREVAETAGLVDHLVNIVQVILDFNAILPEDAWAIVGSKTPLICSDGHPVMFYDEHEAMEWGENVQGRPLRVHIVKKVQD